MIDRPPSKKRLPVDKNRLSLADQQAFERVAAVLQKPVSELYEGNPYNTSLGTRAEESRPPGDVVYTNPESWPMPTTQWGSSDRWQQDIDSEIHNFVSHTNRPWSRPSGIVLEEESHTDIVFNQWTDNMNSTQAMQLEGREDNGSSDILNQAEIERVGVAGPSGRHMNGSVDSEKRDNQASVVKGVINDISIFDSSSSDILNQGQLRHSASWSHEATADEPWIGVPTDYLAQTTQSNPPASNARGPRQDQDTMDQTSRRRSPSARSESLNSMENEPLFGLDWDELDKPQVSDSGSQVISAPSTTQSDWTMLEKPHKNFEKTFLLENSNSKSIKWISEDSNVGKELSLQKPQRRGPFMDQQLREETSSTRKLKACVRCRMQKIRVSIHHSTALNAKIEQYSAKSTPTIQAVFVRHARPSRSRESTRFRAFGTSSLSARFIVLEKLQDWNLLLGGQR
jgi:hypothetical protein